MRHPFQCIAAVTAHQSLLVACDDAVHCFDSVSFDHRSTWRSLSKAFVTAIRISESEEYVAVTTDEDKAVQVLHLPALNEASRRVLPKRPSSISFTHGDTAILVGDKFGDVYALDVKQLQFAQSATAPHNEPSPLKKFKPSATALTVHSERNRKALENQMKLFEQETLSPAARGRQDEPVLGHVSLLTDMACVTLKNDSANDSDRSYILTSDRDEHIRVSRGLPQAHVVECYCHGHTRFVSKLLVLGQKVLISGGGDNWLGLWDWQSGLLLDKLDLTASFHELYSDGGALAVSGLWAGVTPQESCIDFFCALESVPAFVWYCWTPGESSSNRVLHKALFRVPGNVLDIAIMGKFIYIAIDNTSLSRTSPKYSTRIPALLRYEWNLADGSSLNLRTDVNVECNAALEEHMPELTQDQQSLKVLANRLYGISNLRKRLIDGEQS